MPSLPSRRWARPKTWVKRVTGWGWWRRGRGWRYDTLYLQQFREIVVVVSDPIRLSAPRISDPILIEVRPRSSIGRSRPCFVPLLRSK
jgi:hypothetical protein